MTFRLVDSGWHALIHGAIGKDHSVLRIICPFIKRGAIEKLLTNVSPQRLLVITRFDLNCYAQGVSDLSALRLLLSLDARVRGVRNLHAKVFLFGDSAIIAGSANLTDAALVRNHEFGFVAEESAIINEGRKYFEKLWAKAGPDLTDIRLARWERQITRYLASCANLIRPNRLRDEGADAGILAEPVPVAPSSQSGTQTFVKFFGESHNRAERSRPVLEEVKRAGCHWACTFPRGKRPRTIRDGAIIYLALLVKDPNDILIFGRATGERHMPGRDDATREDIAKRWWKAKWPHYVRVHGAEFINTTFANCVSLNRLMAVLKSDSFAATQRNVAKDKGNTDPRRAYLQQPAVELGSQGAQWMKTHFERACLKFGRVSDATLAMLDWPKLNGFGKGNRA